MEFKKLLFGYWVQEGRRSLGHATKSQGWGQGNQYPGHVKAGETGRFQEETRYVSKRVSGCISCL